VYVREFNGQTAQREPDRAKPQTLTFGVSGLLWRENLIMYDRQTNSWWAQASGTAIDGKLNGTILKMYPQFSMMTWRAWRTDHPNTLVLSKRTRRGLEGTTMGYTDYHRSSKIGVTGRLKFSDKQLPPKARILGFRTDDKAYAVDLEGLGRKGSVAAVTVNGRKLNVIASRDGVSGRVLTTTDDSNPEEIPSSVSYWFAWKAFFPATELIRP
jgi:Protein of unknown function (DUF3179)